MIRSGIGKKNDNVATPDWLYESLAAEFSFNHDPCPIHWDAEKDPDGLKSEWGTRSYVNPPFSQIKKWVEKALLECSKGKLVVMLLTARINSKYWWDLIWPKASEIRFLQGEIRFKDYSGFLPIPIAIVVFDPLMRDPLFWGQLSKGMIAGKEFIRVSSSQRGDSCQYSPPEALMSAPTSPSQICS